jgi:hypothetical protein
MDTMKLKEKLKRANQENKRKNKRIKELTKSRDEWKRKSLMHKKNEDELQQLVKKTKSQLSGIHLNISD